MGTSVSPCRKAHVGDALAGQHVAAHHRRVLRGVAAQVEFECNNRKRFIMFWFQALSVRRFQRRFDRVNPHRPTEGDRKVPSGTVISMGFRHPWSGAYTRSLFSST